MNTMKLIDELKEKVDTAKSKEEIKEILEKAGVALTDDELEKVAGVLEVAELSECAKSTILPIKIDPESLFIPPR